MMLYEEYVPLSHSLFIHFFYHIIVFYPGNLEKPFHKDVLIVINTACKSLLLEIILSSIVLMHSSYFRSTPIQVYDFNKQKTFLKVWLSFDVPAFCSCSAGYSEG